MTAAAYLALAAGQAEHHGNVQLEALPYGIVALVAFAALALVTVSYRNISNRHAHKAEAFARAHENDPRYQVGAGH